MSSYENKDCVKSLYSKLSDRFEQFRSAYLQCLDLCTDSDAANNLEQNFDSCQKTFVEFQERYWIIGLQKEKWLHLKKMTVVCMAVAQRRVRRFRYNPDNELQRLSDL